MIFLEIIWWIAIKTYAAYDLLWNYRKKRPVGVGLREVVACWGVDETTSGTGEQEEADTSEESNCSDICIRCIHHMATSCCGVKKQKLNNAAASNHTSSMNSSTYGGMNHSNHHSNSTMLSNGMAASGGSSRANGICGNSISSSMIVSPVTEKSMQPTNGGRQRVVNIDMVVYCFDVLHSYLHNADFPKAKFTNDNL